MKKDGKNEDHIPVYIEFQFNHIRSNTTVIRVVI